MNAGDHQSTQSSQQQLVQKSESRRSKFIEQGSNIITPVVKSNKFVVDEAMQKSIHQRPTSSRVGNFLKPDLNSPPLKESPTKIGLSLPEIQAEQNPQKARNRRVLSQNDRILIQHHNYQPQQQYPEDK